MSKVAYLWEKIDGQRVRCRLCWFYCRLEAGEVGNCGVRKNVDGELLSLNYNLLCSAAIDPIEKKPLYHFLPGTRTYSIACPGCNFKCNFCQNWQISQSGDRLLGERDEVRTRDIVQSALRSGSKSISYTYTEPTVFFETAADAAIEAKKEGLRNIFVSNGYMTKEAIDKASSWLDAINIDLKAFSQGFYQQLGNANLKPVLETLKHIKRNTNIWLEITTLLINGLNDSDQELRSLTDFIAQELGADVPWHVSAFYPMYKLRGARASSQESVRRAC